MQLLLAHGLGRTPLSLFGLAAALRRAGHSTRFFGYSPTLETLPRIVRRLTSRLEQFAGCGRPVGLVGHSLGGLLLRMALPAVPRLKVHHLVTLGMPTNVPRLATLMWNWFPPFQWYSRDCGRLLASPRAFLELPPVTVPFTPFAGTAGPRGRLSPFGADLNDGVVSVSETRLGVREPELFKVVHTLIMDSVDVRTRILAIMNGSPVPLTATP